MSPTQTLSSFDFSHLRSASLTYVRNRKSRTDRKIYLLCLLSASYSVYVEVEVVYSGNAFANG